jgi:hypothetical protein
MQTSFMHPPFGFALFFLRSVAPTHDYIDKVTGKLTGKITTGQIYWGAVPFVFIQILMVALVLIFPGMVTHFLDKGPKLDPAAVMQQLEVPTPDYGGGDANPYDQDDSQDAAPSDDGDKAGDTDEDDGQPADDGDGDTKKE